MRLLLLAAVAAIASYFIIPAWLFISADGLVQGDLVPVSPIFRVRLDRLLVGCSDRVKQGQPVAIVSNFLAQADYERQYQQSQAQLQFSEIAMEQGVLQAQTNAEVLREKYEASKHDAERLVANYRAYEVGYKSGAISKLDWESKRAEMLSAQSLARSDREAWHLAEQQVARVKTDNDQRIDKNRQMTVEAHQIAARLGHETLAAPVGGYVVNCLDRPQTIVQPGKPLFSIFEPQRAYVLAYLDPNAATKLYVGETAQLKIPGVRQSLSGKIQAIYPDLTKLPNGLTRYFWQKEQWSQYRPVKIGLEGVPDGVRSRLYYGAQVRVRIRNV